MNLLNPAPSALNTERTRLDARLPVEQGADSTGAGAAFGDLLRGLAPVPERQDPAPRAAQAVSTPSVKDQKPPAAPEAPSAPTVSRSEAQGRAAAGESSKSGHPAVEGGSAAVDDGAVESNKEPASSADEAAAAVRSFQSPTLAHWLLGAGTERSAVVDAMPPPANAAPADDVGAARLTRDLLKVLGVVPDAHADGGVSDGAEPPTRFAATLALQGVAQAASPTNSHSQTEGGGVAPVAVAAAPDGALSAALQAASSAAVPIRGETSNEIVVQAPVGAPGFSEEATQAMRGLVTSHREGVHEARLQLNPAELGPVQVRIEWVEGAARIDLSAAHAATRQLFESTLPALADALRADGIAFGGGGVSDWSGGASTPADSRAASSDTGFAGQPNDQREAQPDAQAEGRHDGRREDRADSAGTVWRPDGVQPDGSAGWLVDARGAGGRGGLDLYA